MHAYDFLRFLCTFPPNKTICSSIATLQHKHGVIFIHCSNSLKSFFLNKTPNNPPNNNNKKFHQYTVEPNLTVTNTNPHTFFSLNLFFSLLCKAFRTEIELQYLWVSKGPIRWSLGPWRRSPAGQWPLLKAWAPVPIQDLPPLPTGPRGDPGTQTSSGDHARMCPWDPPHRTTCDWGWGWGTRGPPSPPSALPGFPLYPPHSFPCTVELAGISRILQMKASTLTEDSNMP